MHTLSAFAKHVEAEIDNIGESLKLDDNDRKLKEIEDSYKSLRELFDDMNESIQDVTTLTERLSARWERMAPLVNALVSNVDMKSKKKEPVDINKLDDLG